MEAQKKHLAKANRVAVPFYSPPTRHYGKTPAEIIREARASVMSLSTATIKPVLTNRPFTPKEKERTLFGNIKKRLSRPPSAFSLSYLQKDDSLQRVRLPAIANVAGRKADRHSNIRSVQSLDNLIEEYDAEMVEESNHLRYRGLPFFRVSHSGPEQRKMARATSVTENIPSKVPEKRSIYTISRGHGKDVPHLSHDSYIESSARPSFYKFVLGHQSAHAEAPHSEKSDVTEGTARLHGQDFGSNGEAAGTSEIMFSLENMELLSKENMKAEIDVPTEKVMDFTEIVKDKMPPDSASKKEHLNAEFCDSGKKCLTVNSQTCEMESEYLTYLRKGTVDEAKTEKHKEKELLELYETAEYYGVSLERSNEEGSRNISGKNNKPGASSADKREIANSDYLQVMKENIKNFDLKMKQLNESIETFEEKLNEKNMIYSSKREGDNEEIGRDASNASAFKMNSNKRYHIVNGPFERRSNYGHECCASDMQVATNDSSQIQSIGWDGFWKSSYYRQKGDRGHENTNEESAADDLKERLRQLVQLKRTDFKPEEIADGISELYKMLKNEKYENVYVADSGSKVKILRSLYVFADIEDGKILLNLARIVFALRIECSLVDACKMVFKVARSDANDHLFLELDDILELFLDGIGLVSPLDAAECCIYGYGAIKFLTMNQSILNRLISLGVLDLLILHLKLINAAKSESQTVNEQTQHALFQLTGALRNIAAGEGVLPLFIATNSVPVLCKILSNFRQCEDLVTNISRTLSIISADEDATQVLVSVENILEMITGLIEQYQSNDKILIRLSYCLGNIVAYNDLARIQLSRSESSIMILLRILQYYADKDLEVSMNGQGKCVTEEMDMQVIDDVIVKIVRIIANMCMNPVVGSNLSPEGGNEKNSLKLSRLLTTLLRRKDPGMTLLACLGCLNNISYYCKNHSSLIDITEGVVRVLSLHDEECQAEAARVLGNLTRHKEIRDLMRSTGGIEQMSTLLGSKDKDVYRSACGALVNLMLDEETRRAFVASRGIDRLVDGMEKFSGDWSFAALICRAIWNSCADDVASVMLHNDVERLLNILATSLDEENWNDGDPAWEEFALLATDLLEKINAYLEHA